MMTFNRDVEKDRERTNELMNRPAEERAVEAKHRPNWLGHKGEGNAAIDALLLQGATLAELKTHRDAQSHLAHLRREHGLQIYQRDNRYIFAKDNLIEDSEQLLDAPDERESATAERASDPGAEASRSIPVASGPKSGRLHGLVYLSTGGFDLASIAIEETEDAAQERLGNENVIFFISGHQRAAVLAVVEAVRDVWNYWITTGRRWRQGHGRWIRDHDDWSRTAAVAHDQQNFKFYVYCYRDENGSTFYVGRGKQDRLTDHIRDVRR